MNQGSLHAAAVFVFVLLAAGPALAGGKKDPALQGVTMLPQAEVAKRYPLGDTLDPTVDAAVRALHQVSLSPNAVCGVQLTDGRQFVLLQAETSHADGSVPYVFAFDPSWSKKYLAQGANDQAGAKAFYGNPDRILRGILGSAVSGCVNLRADLGLEPNGTDTGAAPPATSAPPALPGVPTEGMCLHLPATTGASPQTQLAINEQAGAGLLRDGCKTRAAYLALQKRIQKDPNAVLRLLGTQQAWGAYMEAHEAEYYSHSDDPSYYGSSFSMCLSGLQASFTVERTKELAERKPCTTAGAHASPAEMDALKTAEASFSTALKKLKQQRMKEPLFLRALERAQVAWARYASAQIAFTEGQDGGGDLSCGVRELTRLTLARTRALAELAKPKQDTCEAD